MTETNKIKTVILGIGNILLGNEGVGVHIIKKMEKMNLPSSILLVDGSTAGFKLFALFNKYKHSKFIIIDALKINQDPDKQNLENNNKSLQKNKKVKDTVQNKGSIFLIPLEDFYSLSQSEYLNDGFISFHQIAITDVLNLFYLTYGLKIKGFFLGINIFKPYEEEKLNLSMELSKEIKDVIPKAIELVLKHW
ncbi:MAG: hydrogenase maturation protease [Actinobacteria bacterium]|nr:hydrogenase maturation protease [Actinomycetota bacterium]